MNDGGLYEIKINGLLDEHWEEWFEGMTLRRHENAEAGQECTLITGPIADQPALHGLLAKIRDLNLTLISIRRLDPKSYNGPIKAVILDWAGTAVDYGSFAPTEVFVRLFEIHGIKITLEEARAGMGLMKKDHLRKILSIPSVARAWHAEHRKEPTQGDVESLFKEFIHIQLSVLKEYATPIPGLLDVIAELKRRSIKIGSTTGYTRAMMDVLAPEAKKHGYEPDCIVCPEDVPAGRPYPWMCYQNAMQLGVYPMQAMVKVGDTLPDIEEGLNAGMWTVGVSLTGNLLGLNEEEIKTLSTSAKEKARERIEAQLYEAGAHFVIRGIWDLPYVLDKIESRLAQGKST